jgi:hypothetical protein
VFMFCGSLLAAPLSLVPTPLSDESYGESYTAVAHLDNGTYILLQLLFTNAGFGSDKGACRALVVPKGQKAIHGALRGEREDWSFDAANNELRVMTCALKATGSGTVFSANIEGVNVRLETQTPMKRVYPPKRRLVFSGGMFEADVRLPWVKVEAKISGKGLRGAGGKGRLYLDHTRSNAMMKDVASAWIRFRGFHGKSRMLIQVRVPDEGTKPEGWMWKEGSPKPASLPQGKSTRTKKGGKEGLRVTLEGSAGEVTSSRLIFTYRPVEEYGFIGTLAKAIVGNPVIRTYEAQWEAVDGTQIQGILETLDMDD